MNPAKSTFSWLRVLTRLVSLPVILVLLAFNLRRVLFLMAALFPRSASRPAPLRPVKDVLVLIPCRNERSMVPGIFRSLERLDYPREHLRFGLVDDGSTDDTARLMRSLCLGIPRWSVFSLARNLGKAAALNEALDHFQFGEIIYVLDADHRPDSQALRRITAYFADPSVAGVSGRTIPANETASPSTFYASVEGLVHQMVTMRAKDRLGAAPALLGSNCAYRRQALADCGGFRAGALLEDSDMTLALYLSGWRVRFAQDVLAWHQVPETLTGYLQQHARWGRGFNETARYYVPGLLGASNVSPLLRGELVLFSAGYLDRLALLASGGLTFLSLLDSRRFPFPRKLFYLALALPFFQIVAVFAEQKMRREMWLRLPLVPLFFVLDIAAALKAMLDTLRRRPVLWKQTVRDRMEIDLAEERA